MEVTMEELKKFFKKDRYAAHSGIELLEVGPGYAKAKMEIKDFHQNGLGSVQGGAIFTLADLAFAAAGNSYGTVAVAINVSISFVKAATSGTLLAEAKEVSQNPKLASYTVHITDQNGDMIAIFQGMVYRKKDRLDLS